MSQASNAAVSISEGVDRLKPKIVNATANQHIHIAVFDPVQQIHNQIGDILHKGAQMQDMPLWVNDTNRPGAKHT